MNCDYFGKCGSCRLYPDYDEQLSFKVEKFGELFGQKPQVFPSPQSHFRARGEFGIWHKEGISYTMYGIDGGRVEIDRCPIMLEPIFEVMPKLIQGLQKKKLLSYKLFRIDFLSGLSGEMLATLVYHKRLDNAWEEAARAVVKELGIHIVGRSRGQKVVLSQDYITEKLPIEGKSFRYRHYEGSFTQPNPFVNIEMIEWALKQSEDFGGDLLELYCGAGNFTLPLAQNFDKVLATEVSKSSIKAAKENRAMNGVENVEFVRLSAEEVAEALRGERKFRRLANIDLQNYDFRTVFVDPPRCGLDAVTREVVKEFEHIIYISCNPQTLKRDVEELSATHEIAALAAFDQFPYTHHLEGGVVLVRR